jgi:transcriptional regulator with XRE-family HTH domain
MANELNMDAGAPQTICLDGSAARRIREEKKLTQLYVAKVVGVTTDTVSRWENNRYPSIKRENAQRLAEALECTIDEITRIEKRESNHGKSMPPAVRRWPILLLPIFLLALFGIMALLFRQPPPETGSGLSAQRLLPNFAAPGTVIPVRVRIETDLKGGFILRENFPPGWRIVEAYPPASSLDSEEGTARWIVKNGQSQRLIVYLVEVDGAAATGRDAIFQGEVIANPNGRRPAVSVGGAGRIDVQRFQWADLDGDNRIDDTEMLQASDIVEEMIEVSIDWRELERLWDAGHYRWDEQLQQFVPVKNGSIIPPPKT